MNSLKKLVHRRRVSDNNLVTPYNAQNVPRPQPQAQPDTQPPSYPSSQPETLPTVPVIAPPTASAAPSEPIVTAVVDFVNADVKFSPSATYSPSPGSPTLTASPIPPPLYVSREPSVNTSPFTRPPGHSPEPDVRDRHAQLSTNHRTAEQIRAAQSSSVLPSASYDHTRAAPVPTVLPYHEQPGVVPTADGLGLQSSGAHRDFQNPMPGDLPLERSPGQKITPEELRELRELIRQRYELDLQIWSERFLRPRDRDITEEKIRKADALLNKIRRTVITWDSPEYFESQDYKVFQEVARRIHLSGKRDWIKDPPWMHERRLV
ncbi:uncharacterized protein PV09_01904 [Verruconis gallopava]|uniref:Uncharacterized protein n=1 Tax=Verruconis gallopava TaxID=253628 RepID=A0A0D2B724_9PEZI|nr:uncharacterized protein PV09_01904 [Verruconis gallopava]KIW07009.1 hypothetical protein PV09_01904 [Verruconis gallopava]